MNEHDARVIVVEALRSANALVGVDANTVDQFVQSGADLEFSKLEMDSLASMEFCISLELDTGVSLAPDELNAIETAGRLVRIICGQ